MIKVPDWIIATIREQQMRGIYGSVTIQMEAGKVVRVKVEQSIKPPKKTC